MHRKITSIVCAAMLMLLCIPSVSVSAEETTSDSGFYDTLEQFGLAETVLESGQLYYYVSGKQQLTINGTLTTVRYRALYVGSDGSFTRHSNTWYTNGNETWESTTANSPTVNSNNVCAQVYYYFDESVFDQKMVVLTDFHTNDEQASNSVATQISNYSHITRNIYYSPPSGSTLGDIANYIDGGEDPTEPTSSGGFQLPDDWVNGGETLPAGEIDSFQGVNEEDALQQFETLLNDSDSLVNDSSFLDSVGLFWAIIIDFIETLGAWGIVMLLMTFALIAWVLGR